ncbi:hypothetical protein HF320_04965 [Collinsella sp. KGMB02528]|uniref:Uncharacterized protein n=1 Tax=Collinsella acetigenes TaxID=2713419 RepID=A0A7X9UCI5_9ACTN|nr:hypothetical protein [Collinsella acetigenes]NMF55677.1 hypothetical protein [Collinsella acetigenes]
MAFDGVFAFQGKNHITASQLGRLVQGTAGDGRYVLPTQDRLQATMQTANKVVIGSGDLVMDGRYVTNETGAELTVESGTSGYNRNDIVALRYSKDGSTGVESFEPVVIKGAPVTGTAADPAVDAGAISDGSSEALMPLWRIPIRGLAPGTPERIAKVGKTLSEIGDSVSRSEWTYLYGEPGAGRSFVRYRRDGARCVLQWGATQGTSAYWAAGNLPEQMRPADGNVYVPGVCVSPNGTVENVCAYCYVSASTGEVGLQVAATTNRNVWNHGETSWFI